MKYAALLFLLAGCGGGDSVTAPVTPVLSMDASAWTFRYSPGMPEHPVAALGGGWQFDFPAQDGVHYLTTPLTADLRGKTITVEAQIIGSEPVFAWPIDSCAGSPARARIMVERQGDNLRSSAGRWWADTPITLKVGAATVNVLVTGEHWSNVDGILGNVDMAGFADAMANTGYVGLTFGGGCAFGHGAWMASGTARMIVNNFSAG